jgi:acyl-CoA thioester hydrolase
MRRWADPAPRYLEETTDVRVRFQEVDGLRIVWHGHYLSYFEEGRNAFGRRFELEYQDVMREGYVVPLIHVAVDYLAPARFGEVLTVRTRLHPEDAARITFTYRISNADGVKLATGRTVQAFTDTDGQLVLTRPPFYEAFLERVRPELQG